MTVLQVALGGALGAVLRYGVGLGLRFPYATLCVNVLGSVLMGVAFVVMAEKGLDRWQPLLMTGILGGFTTYSAFSLDALRLWQAGQGAQAAVYVLGTVVLCLAGVGLGAWVARAVL